jgi:hypothetical protein
MSQLDPIIKSQLVSDFLRHHSPSELNLSIDSEEDVPVIVAQIDLANELADLINDSCELQDPINGSDILDCLATIGIVMSSMQTDLHNHNYASLAYLYTINPDSIPQVTEYLS